MNNSPADLAVMPRWLRSFEQFWFKPADPSLLGLIRIGCGMIVVYTLLAYSFTLQEFMGEHGWCDLTLRREIVMERPISFGALNWNRAGRLPEPANDFQRRYVELYRAHWGVLPPPPYPTKDEQIEYLQKFRMHFGIDARWNGLPIPITDEERRYAESYTTLWNTPPPAFAKDQAEEDTINAYIKEWNIDPRLRYSKGTPVFSLWFHVTEPTTMAIVHGLFVLAACLFTIGFCTRLTSALTWFGFLCYIHRNTTIVFGVDTMMTIMLFYLMFGPSGAAYSVDRVIRKWWVKAKPGVVAWCYGLFRMSVPPDLAPAEPVSVNPEPSSSANVAIRLVQIHVCIIYLMSGLSKLQGNAWWNGSAIWYTLGNYEFAPMQFEPYLMFLRLLGSNQVLYDSFMTGGGLFTLAFEIFYAPLIWRPRLRWVFLASALILHGGIGLFMGLKTFSLMMLVMNAAFLRKEEVDWVFRRVGLLAETAEAAATPKDDEALVSAPVASSAAPSSVGIKKKHRSRGH